MVTGRASPRGALRGALAGPRRGGARARRAARSDAARRRRSLLRRRRGALAAAARAPRGGLGHERGAFLLLLAPWYPLALSAPQSSPAYPARREGADPGLRGRHGHGSPHRHRAVPRARRRGEGLPARAGAGARRVPSAGAAHAAAVARAGRRATTRWTSARSTGSSTRWRPTPSPATRPGGAVALGHGSPEQVDMGRWRDGTPLPRAVWSAAPSPAQPEERYIFRASHRARVGALRRSVGDRARGRPRSAPLGRASRPSPSRRTIPPRGSGAPRSARVGSGPSSPTRRPPPASPPRSDRSPRRAPCRASRARPSR